MTAEKYRRDVLHCFWSPAMLKRMLISGSLSFEDDRFGEAEASLKRDHREGSTTVFERIEKGD
jgi:hypothetical protein